MEGVNSSSVDDAGKGDVVGVINGCLLGDGG